VADLVEAAIRFVLGKREVSTVLVGYSSLEHLENAVEYASRGPLPAQVMSRLPAVWGGFAQA
jgi:aryl-alcohol dehydrogenase-like predicted oxidoreductase